MEARRGRGGWPKGMLLAGLVSVAAGLAGPMAGLTRAETPIPWAEPIREADLALGRKEYSAALRAAQEAYQAAVASRRWEALIAAGDAYRRLGDATGLRRSFDPKARESYLAALMRARGERSVEGVLQVAEAFLGFGDRELAIQCVRLAERLAVNDREARASVRAFALRFDVPLPDERVPR